MSLTKNVYFNNERQETQITLRNNILEKEQNFNKAIEEISGSFSRLAAVTGISSKKQKTRF